jgi:hypothetical protein
MFGSRGRERRQQVQSLRGVSAVCRQNMVAQPLERGLLVAVRSGCTKRKEKSKQPPMRSRTSGRQTVQQDSSLFFLYVRLGPEVPSPVSSCRRVTMALSQSSSLPLPLGGMMTVGMSETLRKTRAPEYG